MSQDNSEQARGLTAAAADGSAYYTIEVVTARSGLGVRMVERCISYGIIHPQQLASDNQPQEVYTDADVLRLRKVRRLVSDLGLNWAGVEVVMRLTDELERLQQELDRLRHL